MLYNYLKIALRNLIRHKGYSCINIIGLAAGLACCMLIFLWIQYELSYDRYHMDSERIFRVATDSRHGDEVRITARTSAPVSITLRKDFPQIEHATGILPLRSGLVRRGNVRFYEDGRIFADQSFFNVFGIPFIAGDPETALARPTTVVVTERIAHKYFGSENPIGQVININSQDCEVTGVVPDTPPNTHFRYSMVISMKTIEGRYPFEEWFLGNFYTYIKLAPNVDLTSFSPVISHFADPYVADALEEAGEELTYFLQPIKDIHLHSNLLSEPEDAAGILYIYIFAAIGILILIIASVNYVNLTTARCLKRAREVGVRKVVGSRRSQLIWLFLLESILSVSAAVIPAAIMVELLIPMVNNLTGASLVTGAFFQPAPLSLLLGLILFIGIGAGIYPAIILANLKPSSILGSKAGGGHRAAVLRKMLVVGQFAISVFLIVCTVTVYQQLDFMKDRDLGFASEQKLVLPLRGGISIRDNYESVRTEFLKIPEITGLTGSSVVPGQNTSCWNTWLTTQSESDSRVLNYIYSDEAFVPEYGLEIIAGEPLRPVTETDSTSLLMINECAARALGFTDPHDAVGREVTDGRSNSRIVGVVRDFHYWGLQNQIEPLAIERNLHSRHISLTVTGSDPEAVLASVEQTWQKLFPDHPFEYFFLDVAFNEQYSNEERHGRVIGIFSLLGLAIACLGLFGLSAFTAEQRTKEIGIRKVMGATIHNIVTLLSREFVLLVLAANILAWPAAYLAMDSWLEGFAYRMDIGWGIFILAGVLALAIALLTVSFQAIRAALANPVEAIRYE